MRIAAGFLPFFSQVRGHIKNLLKLMQSMMDANEETMKKSHASSVLEKLFMLFRSLFSLLS